MKLIPLTQGRFARVDDADFAWLNQWKWRAVRCDKNWYARRDEAGKSIYMHREIIKAGPREGHHKDGDGLNNQRENLSRATRMGNAHGFMRIRANKTSKFRGVSWAKNVQKWLAHIRINYVAKHLGLFATERDAAIAFDTAARAAFGVEAQLNFP